MANQIEKKSGGFLGKIVALLIGLLLGIVAGIGGLAAGGYIIVTKVKIKDGVDTVNGFIEPDVNTLDIVTEEYAEKTLYDVFGALIEATTALQDGSGTLQAFADISPLVGTAVEMLVSAADSYGLKLEKEELMSTPMSGMQEYLTNAVGDMEIRALIQNFGGSMDQNDPIMQAILYGVKGVAFNSTTDGEGNPVIEMLPYYYHYKITSNTFVDETDTVYSFDGTKYVAENGSYIIPYTGADETYDFELYNSENVLVYQLSAKADDPNVYGAFVNGELILHKPNILRPLLSGQDGFADMLKPVYVGDFFTVTPDSDDVLIALAYGELNKDYYIDHANNKIVPITTPTKLGDLTDGNIEEVFAKITLDSVVEIDLNNGLMKAIAYGKRSHYTIVEDGGVKSVKMLPKRYTVDGGKLLDDDGEEVPAILVDGIYVITRGENVTYAVYDSTEDCYFEYTKQDAYTDANIVTYPKTTVMDMKDGLNTAISEVTIGDLISGITEENILLWSIKDWGINELKSQEKIMSLKLCDVMEIPEDGSVLDLLRNAEIGKLSDEINHVKLLAFIDDEAGAIYQVKKDASGNAINADGDIIYYSNSKKQFYTTSDFQAGTETTAIFVDKDGDDLEYNSADKKWYKKGTTTESKRELTGSWYFMFTDNNPSDGTTLPEEYTVHDIHALVDNMNANINNATIGELAEHGILEVSDATLNSYSTKQDGSGNYILIKNLLVSDALDLLATIGNSMHGGGA